MIICGYQGCGKTSFCKANPDTTVDLDSSLFVKRDGWQYDYLKIAIALSKTGKKVFISAHQVVIEALMEQRQSFHLLTPAINPKAWRSRLEFRYHLNPTDGNFNALQDFDKNYEKDMAFYSSIENSLLCTRIEISAKVVTDLSKCFLENT